MRERGQWDSVLTEAEWVVSKVACKKGAYQIIYEGFEGEAYDAPGGALSSNLRFWGDEAALHPGNFLCCYH